LNRSGLGRFPANSGKDPGQPKPVNEKKKADQSQSTGYGGLKALVYLENRGEQNKKKRRVSDTGANDAQRRNDLS